MNHPDYLTDHFDLLLEGMRKRNWLTPEREEGLNRARNCRNGLLMNTRIINRLREEKNQLSKEFGERRRDKLSTDDLSVKIAAVQEEIDTYEAEQPIMEEELHSIMSMVPNIPDPIVPKGTGEADNVTVRTFGVPRVFDFRVRDHIDLGVSMGCMDFEQTAKVSGSRFVTLSGALAKLERVLGQWMLDDAVVCRGFREMSVPHLVKADAMYGTGQLPKFEDDLFRAGDHYLIPTAEVSLTNMVRDQIVDFSNGPLKLTALTPCYRAEAGSAGRDTRGMIRLHQFNKVELVIICPELFPTESLIGHIIVAAEDLLEMLELPYVRKLLCAGDLGFSAEITHDLEVWFPAQQTYREISSISSFGDFQGRRMNTRYRREGKGTAFVHTLNGSALAVGRTLAAIMENNQTEDGGVAIPPVLRQRMGGTFIAPDGKII